MWWPCIHYQWNTNDKFDIFEENVYKCFLQLRWAAKMRKNTLQSFKGLGQTWLKPFWRIKTSKWNFTLGNIYLEQSKVNIWRNIIFVHFMFRGNWILSFNSLYAVDRMLSRLICGCFIKCVILNCILTLIYYHRGWFEDHFWFPTPYVTVTITTIRLQSLQKVEFIF